MARANLTAMLGRLDDDEPAAAPTAPAVITTPTPAAAAPAGSEARPKKAAPAKEPKQVTPRARTAAPTTAPKTAVPRAEQPLFLRLERKETRLRADQYADLTAHARRLSQAKTGGGERITENTLIRVAIDLLLERASQLAGETEAEIKKSATR